MNGLFFKLRCSRVVASAGILIKRTHQPIASHRRGSGATRDKTEVARPCAVVHLVSEMLFEEINRSFGTDSFFGHVLQMKAFHSNSGRKFVLIVQSFLRQLFCPFKDGGKLVSIRMQYSVHNLYFYCY